MRLHIVLGFVLLLLSQRNGISWAQAPLEHLTTRECILKKEASPNCEGQGYQTFDGSCNNPLNPVNGKAWTPFKRLLPPSYGNRLNSFRLACSGKPLPSCRVVSNGFKNQTDRHLNFNSVNAIFFNFVGYIFNDLAATPVVEEEDAGVRVDCYCSDPSPSCINIPISKQDRFYKGQDCIKMKRSQTASGCDEFPAEQINAYSSYIDAGNVYSAGWNNKLLFDLHETTSGEGLPHSESQHSMQVIFRREHNRIARRFKSLHSDWPEEKIFHEARRIIIAMHQLILYNELLPLLLGPKLMKDFDLEIVKNGFYFGYDASYDATISNAFASAAFRYHHNEAAILHRLFKENKRKAKPFVAKFRGTFHGKAGGDFHRRRRELRTDVNEVKHNTNYLRSFEHELTPRTAHDMLAIHMQRGRSHGLAPYNDFRELCGIPKANTWQDMKDTIPEHKLLVLKNVYENIDDVDLFVGGISETPLSGGNIGPTFGCIIGYQFGHLRKGDSFWFERPGQFTEAQLKEIRKMTFSRVLCNNMNGMTMISPKAMELEGEANTRIPCSQVPQMNLESWKSYSHEQDGTWTRWFLKEEIPVENVVQKLRIYNSDSVCKDPLDFQVQRINEETEAMKIRFYCPAGSIAESEYLNSKDSLDHYWTNWFDRDSPLNTGDDIETLEHLREERPREICKNPLYMQAQTKEGYSAFNSSEVFREFSPRHGLTCYGSDQVDGKCKDYRVRFYCLKMFKKEIDHEAYKISKLSLNRWSAWINIQNPSESHYDVENVRSAIIKGNNICRKPLLIEARVAGTKTELARSGDVLMRFSVKYGLICDNRDQLNNQCQDYEVRFLCPIRDIP